ncbi:MAG: hypothetical protein AAB568_03970 [Patescibacteria group bacterium]
MKRKSKEDIKSITVAILKILGATSGITLLAMLNNGRNSDKLFKGLVGFSRWQISKTLKQLRLRGYVQFDEKDDKTPILLTPKGLKRSLHFQLFGLSFNRSKKWDYLWRMVIFDIPEKKKAMRESFRRELNCMKFYKLQKSVFVTPQKCEKEIIEIGRACRILSHILILTVASLGPLEKRVRRYFFDML